MTEHKLTSKNQMSAHPRIALRQPSSKAVTVKVKATTDYQSPAIAKRVTGVLGQRLVAALLDVAPDRPGRWARDQGSPTQENLARLADLDALIGHLLTAFTEEQAALWLEGVDPNLGARPLDVYRIRGSAPVIEAMKSYQQGAFAYWTSGG